MTEAATSLRKLGPRGLLAVLLVGAASMAGAAVGAIAVLLWAQLSRTPMPELGLKAPTRWLRVLAEGAALGTALKLVMKALVMPLVGAPAVNTSYQYLAGNTAALPGIVGALVLAGVAEELVYRGYVFERLRVVLGSGQAALWTSVLVSAAVFALAHYREQGILGVAQSAVTGLAFAGMLARRGELWTPIIAHITFNFTSVALIYWSWEEAVARAVFR